MIVSHHDPERPRLCAEEKQRMDALWRRRMIGDATYMRSLMILGYGDRDARTELSLLEMERRG